jgi:hypothetical protein
MTTPDIYQLTSSGRVDRFPAPTAGGCQGSTLVLAVGPFRDWLDQHMHTHELTSVDVARRIGRDEAMCAAGSACAAAIGATNHPTTSPSTSSAS